MSFISKPIEPEGGFDPLFTGRGDPTIPSAFRFGDDRLVVSEITKVWRSTKEDRGDVYLKRHWFEFTTVDGRTAVVYFDRAARRGEARWYLYTLSGR